MTEHPQDNQPEKPSASRQYAESMPPYDPQAAPQYSAPQYSRQPAPMAPSDQRTWALATHLSPFLAIFTGFSLLGPLIGYLVFRDRGAFIRHHATEALNFQLTMCIAFIVSIPLLFVLVGFVTLGIILVAWVVCPILAAVAANQGRDFRYPLTIRLVH